MNILDTILGVVKLAAPLVPVPGASLVPDIIDAIPGIEQAVKDALTKAGYTNEQIDAIFSDVLPLDQLGIDPNHPVAPEPAAPAPAKPAATPMFTDLPPEPAAPTQQQISQSQPFIHATHVPLSGKPQVEPAPAKPGMPNPFERAR